MAVETEYYAPASLDLFISWHSLIDNTRSLRPHAVWVDYFAMG